MREEQRAKRKRLLSAAMSARIRRGMIRYLQVTLPPGLHALLRAGRQICRRLVKTIDKVGGAGSIIHIDTK